MCAQCEEGYWKPRNTFVCYPCDFAGTGLYIAQGFFLLLIFFLVYRQLLRNFTQPKNEGIAIWRIVINQFHFLYILNALSDSQYNLGAYKNLKNLMDNINLLFNPFSVIAARDCLGISIEEQIDNFYIQVYVMVALPVVIVLFNFTFWFVGTKIAKATGDKQTTTKLNWARLFNRIAILSGIMLYFCYPNIIELLMQSINCFPSLR